MDKKSFRPRVYFYQGKFHVSFGLDEDGFEKEWRIFETLREAEAAAGWNAERQE